MDIRKFIRLGDKIQIASETGEYATIVERVEDETYFYISTPWFEQRKVELVEAEVYSFSTKYEKGIVSFHARITGFDLNDNIPLIKVEVISEPERLQRRKSYRVNLMLDVKIRDINELEPQENADEYVTKTLNISETGMLFLANKKYLPQDMLLCKLDLDKFDMNASLNDLKAKVVRCEYPQQPGEQYRVSVAFVECSGQCKALLGKFIIRSQLRNR